MKLIHWLFVVCLLTSSFDIFLVVNVGGTVRFTQVVMIAVCIGALAKAAQIGRIDWPKAGGWLLLWCFMQIIFLPNSIDYGFAFKYLLFLFYTVICFFAVVHLYGKSPYITKLMSAYLSSFVVIACIGLLQFFMPLLHLGSFLVQQWIVYGRFARINGFCYEPSYYATYMLPAWITMLDLRKSKANVISGPVWRWLVIAVGMSLFLSTSRTAWGIMILEGSVLGGASALRWVKSIWRRLNAGRLVVKIPRTGFVLLGVAGVVLIVVGLRALQSLINLNIFLSGTGINNTAAHSVNDRTTGFWETLAIFREHPFIGRSLGGVSSRLSELHGVPNDGKTYLGFPVIMDLFAASGLIGIIPFLVFLWSNTIGFFPLIKQNWPDERAKWLRALVRGTIYLWITLMVDQNVLRVYLWFHMSIVAAVALNISFRPATAPLPDIDPVALPA